MLTLVIFLVVLALLVIVHEFGHFVTARKAGIKCLNLVWFSTKGV